MHCFQFKLCMFELKQDFSYANNRLQYRNDTISINVYWNTNLFCE